MPRKLLTAFLTFTLVTTLNQLAIANPFGRAMIVNTAFTVKAGDAKYWTFRVGSDGPMSLGRFRAEGEGGNDIKCLILDADRIDCPNPQRSNENEKQIDDNVAYTRARLRRCMEWSQSNKQTERCHVSV